MLTDAEIARYNELIDAYQAEANRLNSEIDRMVIALNQDRQAKLRQHYIDEYGIEPGRWYTLRDTFGNEARATITSYDDQGRICVLFSHSLGVTPMRITDFIVNYKGLIVDD